MEKITKIEDFQTYIDRIKWFDDYNKNYGKVEIEKPELSECVKKSINKNGILSPVNLSSELFYSVIVNRLNQLVNNYIIDDDNKSLIKEVSMYSTREGKYSNDIHKGFLIMGGTGTGKTKIANAFIDVLRKFFMINIAFTPSYKFVEDFTKFQYEGLVNKTRNLKFIDDLGSENLFNNYGVTTNVLLEFVYRAYDAKSKCFATTNLDPASLKKFYGERGYSRMVEMFYFFTLKGNDKRS